jgi:hypothetical protein
MAQGYTGYSIFSSEVSLKDSANLDAFSRLRVSNPLILHNSQFTYDLCPIIYEAITSASSGTATVTHDTTNKCALMTFTSAATGAKAYMQSYEYLSYQPGRSQLVFVTFNMISQVANTLKFAGYSDGLNGVEFQNNGTTNQFVVYSQSTAGNETKVQADWNLDKLDGTGPSGYNLDITKTQILVIDIQALYVGRVRVGFDVGGTIVYAHEFKHANISTYPYIQTANLPIRCGMTSTGTVSTTMNFICSAVMSEGGTEDINSFGYTFAQNSGSITLSTSNPTNVLSLRPRTTFPGTTSPNNFVNRIRVSYIDVELVNTTANTLVYWQLTLGQTFSGTPTWTHVNTTYSSVEYSTSAITTASPLIVIDAGYISGAANVHTVINTSVNSRYPITLNQAGTQRSQGTLSLIATAISGSNPNIYGTIKFRETR